MEKVNEKAAVNKDGTQRVAMHFLRHQHKANLEIHTAQPAFYYTLQQYIHKTYTRENIPSIHKQIRLNE